jgi:hypothetical protein
LDPDLLVKVTDPRIRIRTKMSRIPNTAVNNFSKQSCIKIPVAGGDHPLYFCGVFILRLLGVSTGSPFLSLHTHQKCWKQLKVIFQYVFFRHSYQDWFYYNTNTINWYVESDKVHFLPNNQSIDFSSQQLSSCEM